MNASLGQPASRSRTDWIGFQTIVLREFNRILRIWGQTLLPPAVTATLYFIIFGSLIGSRIGRMGGYDYMQYIAPGLIMMSVITNSYGNVVCLFRGEANPRGPNAECTNHSRKQCQKGTQEECE